VVSMRMFNRLTIAGIPLIFGLSLFDAWKTTNRLGTSVLIALAPTLIVAATYFVAARLGRKTGRQWLLKFAATFICLFGLVAYAGYALTGPGDPDTASQMHVFFFPAFLGLIAVVVAGVCVLVAYARPPKSNNTFERPGGP
jgi:hypothetical protein